MEEKRREGGGGVIFAYRTTTRSPQSRTTPKRSLLGMLRIACAARVTRSNSSGPMPGVTRYGYGVTSNGYGVTNKGDAVTVTREQGVERQRSREVD
jgi:hypothetical protein